MKEIGNVTEDARSLHLLAASVKRDDIVNALSTRREE